MTDDATLGGYLARHKRPPAFAGSDGKPYSVEVYVDDEPGADGRFGAAVLFVRWSDAGDVPVGHLESGHLASGATAAEAAERVRSLTLHDVKDELDRLIERQRELPDW